MNAQAHTTQTINSPLVKRIYLFALDLIVIFGFAWAIASLLGIQFLLSTNLPTGGDAASHLLYAYLYSKEILPSGHITSWMPEVFAGFSFLSYYFPFAFITIAALAQFTAFAPAMKIGMFAAAMLMPGAVWAGSVYLLKQSRYVALWGTLATLAFLLHEQNALWGGNLMSTLAGEFTQSYGAFFSILTLMAWARVIQTGKHWWLAALLEALTGFSNGFALLITGFATGAFLFDRAQFPKNLKLLCLGHSLAFLMLCGWLLPMIEMHSLTIPNDALFQVDNLWDFAPPAVIPVGVAALLGLIVHAAMRWVPALKRRYPISVSSDTTLRYAYFLGCSAVLGAVGYLAGSAIGLANIRFFPFVWLYAGVAGAWIWATAFERLLNPLTKLSRTGLHFISCSAAVFYLGWISTHLALAPDWGLWNHSGLESKPQWEQLTTLFPGLKGQMQSPRLLFEHDPANNDIGSTRALEALPMFLNGRPVLEGLYMESALVSPAIYQLQSEVSTHPSSPLARFPSGSLDLEFATKHMNFLYSNQVLIRNQATLDSFRNNKNFTESASAVPFHVFNLNSFNTHLVDTVDRPVKWYPKKNWFEESFQWFKSRSRFDKELPVFTDSGQPPVEESKAPVLIESISITRESISWTTNQIGVPHLVRFAWHPKWHLATKGSLFLAAPGFMLVIPQEQKVRLEYSDTAVGTLGGVATFIGLSLLVLLIVLDIKDWLGRREMTSLLRSQDQTHKAPFHHAVDSGAWPTRWSGYSLVWPIALALLGRWFYIHNPERLYTDAWALMRSNHNLEAAAEFDLAYQGRKSNAKKEEALFWAAKAYELANKKEISLAHYKELTTNFKGFWLPEALYTQALIEEQKGEFANAQATRARLLTEFPSNQWSQRVSVK